jgi:hypothetical protein
MHKTRVDRRLEKFFGATIPTPPKAVKRRGQYWVTLLTGKFCYHGSVTFHIKDEITDWIDNRTTDWYVTRSEDWDGTTKLRLFLPSLELITEFRLVWSDIDYNS